MGALHSLLFALRKKQWNLTTRYSGEVIRFRRHGLSWNAFAWDQYVGRILFEYGSWQFREIDLVIDWLTARNMLRRGCGTVVNIGAFIGSTAIRLAQQTKGRVLAIEPVPDFYNLLRQNIEINGFSADVICHRGALHDAPAELSMAVTGINPGASEIRVNGASLAESDFPMRQEITVFGRPLFEIFDCEQIDSTEVQLVWADVQGCEGHVLRSGAKLWERGVPLVIEFWPRGFHQKESESIVPLISKYFRAFCTLPQEWYMPAKLTERPIAELDDSIVGESSHIDLLLLP